MHATFQNFAFAAGSVTGREHQVAGRNNQDAWLLEGTPQLTLLLVSDGCGSAAHSEVGAWIGIRWLAQGLKRRLLEIEAQTARPQAPVREHFEQALEGARLEVLERLEALVKELGQGALHDHLLFTLVGAALTPAWSALFALGDGLLVLNGETLPLGPFANNQPPYLAYGLEHREHPRFELLRVLETEKIESVLVGTDGAAEWPGIVHRAIPGKFECAGPLEQFWRADKYFRNPDQLRRQLALLNRAQTRADWDQRVLDRQPGLLRDDTTIVVARRERKEHTEIRRDTVNGF